jgi:ribosomal protein S4E
MPSSPKKKIKSKRLTVKDLINMNVPYIYTNDGKIIIINDKKLADAYQKKIVQNVQKELKKSMPWLKDYY